MKITKLNSSGFEHVFLMVLTVLLISAVGTYLLVLSHAATRIPRSDHIVDVSWPNCPGVKAAYGVIGLNNGKPLTRNPCLSKEARYISHDALYANASYNGQRLNSTRYPCKAKTNACSAYNYGYKAGLYDVKLASSKGLYSNLWWIDVEDGPQGNNWSGENSLNVEYLRGMMDAIGSQGIPNIGFYSTSQMWGHITGNWTNNHPVWYATGESSKRGHAAAVEHCGQGFTGGSVWLVQYVDHTTQLDVNFTCDNSFHSSL